MNSFSKVSNSKYKYVQDIIKDKFKSLHNSYVYTCGSFKMVNDVKALCIKKGLKINNYVSDAFIQTGD